MRLLIVEKTLVDCVNIVHKEDNPCLHVLLTLGDSTAFPQTFICMFVPMKCNKILISLKEGGKKEALGCFSEQVDELHLLC